VENFVDNRTCPAPACPVTALAVPLARKTGTKKLRKINDLCGSAVASEAAMPGSGSDLAAVELSALGDGSCGDG
jgi:hypothetical protein